MTERAVFAGRNLAVDMLRALTMFTMIFVNDLWTARGVPHWLEHAAFNEDFMGMADFVLPCFLFAMGMSIPYAVESRFAKHCPGESTLGHILSRTFALLVMGAFIVNSEAGVSASCPYSVEIYRLLMVCAFICLWNVYPREAPSGMRHVFSALKWLGAAVLIYLALSFRDAGGGVFASRWWGILGIIGWAYIVCATAYLLLRNNRKYLWIVLASMLFLSFLTTPLKESFGGVPVLDLPRGNFLGSLLGIFHVGNGSMVALGMGGVMLSVVSVSLGEVPAKRRLVYSLCAACIFLTAGIVSHHFYIVSKLGATPPWVLYVFATCVFLYGMLRFMVHKGITAWFRIFKPAGTATLTCYVMPYAVYSLSYLFNVHVPRALTVGTWGLLNCLAFSFFIIFITWCAGKLHIKLKI